MTSQLFDEWFARARKHQTDGRPVDAMLCYRRAIREYSRNADARFHLGEVLWQLGLFHEAIAVWREATELAPQQPASHQALADALLTIGKTAEAAEVASRVRSLVSDDGRAEAIVAIATLDSDHAAGSALVDGFARNPQLITVPAIAESFATLLDRKPPLQRADSIIAAILGIEGVGNLARSIPASLFAILFEHLATPETKRASVQWIDAALGRAWTLHDHDALRRVACTMHSVAPAHAIGLAQHYAALCARVDRHGAPLLWPRRTSGGRLRVILITLDNGTASEPARTLSRLSNERFDVRSIDARGIDARQVAEADADVIVDFVGLAAPVGEALAQRPARRRMTVETLSAHNHPPLIDDVAYDTADLVAKLSRLSTSIESDDEMPNPAAMSALWRSAVEAHRAGDRLAARAGYERVLQLQPGFAAGHHLLGVVLRELDDNDAARSQFAAAMAHAPDYAAPRVDAIRAGIEAGDVKAAIAHAEDAIANCDEPPLSLLRAVGTASLAARDGERAAAWFEASLLRDPTDAETHYNRGVALQMLSRNADAARSYQRALAFSPDLVAADFNLGTIFMAQGNRDAAIAAFSAVIAREPRHVAAYKNLGELLFAAGRLEEWRANFRRFETNCPDALPLAVHALEVCQYCGEFDRVDRYIDGLRNERFKSRDVRELADSLEALLYLLLYFDVEPDLILRFAHTYDRIAGEVYGEPLPPRSTRRAGKIRIGYISADLRNHVMGKMIWEAVSRHDRDRFELAFYSLSGMRDDWTARFESIADRFVGLASLSEEAAAARIADDDLDLLVDLATHTKDARPGILARKPARVQISHVASAGTLGLSTIDFKLTDRFADLEENRTHQIEALLPMKGCVYPYRPIGVAHRERFRRDALGIEESAILIGAFVSGLKLSRRCLSIWRDVLLRIPEARLAFSPVNLKYASLYRQIVEAAGIDARRIAFLPQSATDAENQARYAPIDFALDPMPYGNVNGTLEALDMKIPVVTLVGRRHSERTSFSILSNLGVTQTIAHSGSEYVEIAVRLARDRKFRDDVIAAIDAGLSHSPLTDMNAHARNLEEAYLEALRRKAPAALTSIVIDPLPQ